MSIHNSNQALKLFWEQECIFYMLMGVLNDNLVNSKFASSKCKQPKHIISLSLVLWEGKNMHLTIFFQL